MSTTLQTRARFVFEPSGVRVTHLVLCPSMGKARDVRQCARCPSYEGQPAEGGVACRLAGESPGRTQVFSERIWSLLPTAMYCIRDDMHVGSALALVLDAGVSALVVVDADNRPRGMLTRHELRRAVFERHEFDELHHRVGDALSPTRLIVRESATLGTASRLMLGENTQRVSVVDAEGEALGVLSASDIARWMASPG